MVTTLSNLPANPRAVFNDTYIALCNFSDIHLHPAQRFGLIDLISSKQNYPQLDLGDIIDIMCQLGWTPHIEEMKLNDVSTAAVPAISHINLKGSFGLFVCVVSVNKHSIIYIDPATHQPLERSFTSLEETWSGLWLTGTYSSTTQFNLSSLEINIKKAFTRSFRVENDLLSSRECAELINLFESTELFQRSRVEVKNVEFESDKRTSYSQILDIGADPLLKGVTKKISDWVGVPVDDFEPLQCVKYYQGNEFRLHFDSSLANRRSQTVLLYLNDDFTGGETFFPEIPFRVEPKVGKGLTFSNLNDDGSTNIFSLHAGLPVISGTKYAINLWSRQRL